MIVKDSGHVGESLLSMVRAMRSLLVPLKIWGKVVSFGRNFQHCTNIAILFNFWIVHSVV